nr:MAG TPA: hypothetical protein [Caudoviricetes sp.]
MPQPHPPSIPFPSTSIDVRARDITRRGTEPLFGTPPS